MIKINSNYFITIKILNINSIRILNTGLGFLSQQIQGIQKKKKNSWKFLLNQDKVTLGAGTSPLSRGVKWYRKSRSKMD